MAGPVLDLVGFTWFTLNGNVNARNGNVAATAIDAAATVAFTMAGVEGVIKIGRCRTARAQLAARLGPGPVGGLQVAPQPGPVQPTRIQPAAVSSGVLTASSVIRAIVVSPPVDSLSVGKTVQLTAVARTTSGMTAPDSTLTWQSSRPRVATVTSGGLVTARAVGQAVISATMQGVVGQATVVVGPPR